MSVKPSADKKPQEKEKKIVVCHPSSAPTKPAAGAELFPELSTGRGGSGNIRRVKSTKEIISRPLASPRLLELEPPRNRVRVHLTLILDHTSNAQRRSCSPQAAHGGRGGSGNVWTHVIEEGVFDRVLTYEISRARVLKEERAHEKAERRKSGAAVGRARSQSDAKSSSSDCRSPLSLYSLPATRVILTPHVSLARSLARATSRKSWGSNSEVEPARPLERRKSLANTFLAPLRNTFRSSQGARNTSELALCSSESGHSLPSSDRASLSGLSNHASPSTPNLSPTSPGPAPPPPSSKRRWTASGHRAPATDRSLARARHLSNPLPPPERPIPPIPHVHFIPRLPGPATLPMPMQKPIPTDHYSPSTPIDDSFGLLQAAAVAASKARPNARPILRLTPPERLPELFLQSSSNPGYPSTAPPSRPRAAATMYTLSHSARSTSAIPSRAESGVSLGRPTAEGSEGDLIDPALLSEGDLIDPYLLSEGGDGRYSGRGHHTAVPTVSSLASILPWLQDPDFDSIIPALTHAE